VTPRILYILNQEETMEIKLTESNFQSEVVDSRKKVLVDFWAEWCAPCRMLSPLISEVAEENAELKVGKVNVDEEISLAQKFGITSIPTLILFENGKIQRTSVGCIPKEKILEFIK
jgi:thioredoxin 1